MEAVAGDTFSASQRRSARSTGYMSHVQDVPGSTHAIVSPTGDGTPDSPPCAQRALPNSQAMPAASVHAMAARAFQPALLANWGGLVGRMGANLAFRPLWETRWRVWSPEHPGRVTYTPLSAHYASAMR